MDVLLVVLIILFSLIQLEPLRLWVHHSVLSPTPFHKNLCQDPTRLQADENQTWWKMRCLRKWLLLPNLLRFVLWAQVCSCSHDHQVVSDCIPAPPSVANMTKWNLQLHVWDLWFRAHVWGLNYSPRISWVGRASLLPWPLSVPLPGVGLWGFTL